MLTHYESRLADVLGTRLGAPFTGRAFVAPGPDDAQPALLVGTRTAEVVAEDFGSKRPEVVPGDDDRRRVVRLRCLVDIEVRPGTGGARPDRLAALDAALYVLDAPDLRDASALTAPGDPGFALSAQRVRAVRVALEDGVDFARLEIEADGWFWPPEAPGEDGGPIAETITRLAGLPFTVSPWPVLLRAGAAAQDLEISLDETATRIHEGGIGAAVPARFAVRVLDAGDRPGAGAVIGGDAGPGGSRAILADGGVLRVTYEPPGTAAVDRLVVSFLRSVPGEPPQLGAKLGEFRIEVRA